ncbi:uncharacterized protein LOC129587192 [Paramacrobiotus metropolitanus]|uniref:uncharacterized protein LOC129587192 n=1 Tax=Paramacrobiotus metropolitanus TaxID=2943436 RepID=UPI00244626C8|nr:uncharacterized protein LOC129587192 [Paramacrobiotus metropolitanus]XP_055336786.1 uncharacterized protein LOC129587192 [Paramacrobiotus metropolitanus]
MCLCCCNPCSLCCAMGKSCCKSLCDYCDVRGHLRQPWRCCSTLAIVSLVFAVILIPTGLTVMGFFVDYHDSDKMGYRILAWFGIASFLTGIGLLSLGLLLCGCVWRVYHLREKTRIHLEMKQGTLYLGSSAASRFSNNKARESPMLSLRSHTETKAKQHRDVIDVENLHLTESDVRLTKIQPRPISVQTFQNSDRENDNLPSSPPPGAHTLTRNGTGGFKDTTLTRKPPVLVSSLKRQSAEMTIGGSGHSHISPPPKPPRDPGQLV